MSNKEPKHGTNEPIDPEVIDAIRYIIQAREDAYALTNTFWFARDELNGNPVPSDAATIAYNKLRASSSMGDKFIMAFDNAEFFQSVTLAQIDHADNLAGLEQAKDDFGTMIATLRAAEIPVEPLPREDNRTIHLGAVKNTVTGTRNRVLFRLTSVECPELADKDIDAITVNKRMEFAFRSVPNYLKPYIKSHAPLNETMIAKIENLIDKRDRNVITPIGTTYYLAVAHTPEPEVPKTPFAHLTGAAREVVTAIPELVAAPVKPPLNLATRALKFLGLKRPD